MRAQIVKQGSTASRVVKCLWATAIAASALLGSSASLAADNARTASDALPGLDHVGVAVGARPAVAGTLGYGISEPQNDDDGLHHRLSLRAAAAAPVLRWLQIGGSVDGRYDQHSDDSGAVIGAALDARAFTAAGNWQLGCDLIGRLPGANDFSGMVQGISPEVRALAATTSGQVLIATMAGYRLDRSGATAKNADSLSPGDRFALGVSDFDAVLLGVGATVPVGQVELLGELSADILVGHNAPAFRQSPLRISAGMRKRVAHGLTLELLAVGSLSAQPDLSPGAPLVPNEPRFSLFAGLRYEFLPHVAPPIKTAPAPPPVVAPKPEAPLEVAVTDDQGAPIPGVRAFVIVDGAPRELSCDETGHCRIDHVPAGSAVVRIEAPGFEPNERPLTVGAGAPAKLALRLVAVPPPSQIRGVVRSFDGKAVGARIRIEPPGTETRVDDKGSFQIDVPPGSYDIVVEAAGYVTQRRRVQVEPQGVVILNADLVKKP